MRWGNQVFKGSIPRVDRRLLPEGAAQLGRNCWLDQDQPRPIPALRAVAGVSAFSAAVESIYRFDANRWFAWNHRVNAVPAPVFDDASFRTIWTQGSNGNPRMTSTTIMGGAFRSPGIPISRRLGVPAPTSAPTAVAGDAPDPADDTGQGENHAWLYTFVSDLNEEGPPSAATPVVARAFGMDGSIQPVTLSNLDTAPPTGWEASGLSIKRLYRTATGSSGTTTYQFLADIPIAQDTYTDSTLTSGLGSGLVSEDWLPPAEDLEGLISLPNGILAAFRGREIHFSEPYQPHAWPSEYVFVVDADIVGMDNFGTTLVVGTKGDPHLISGSHPLQMSGAKMEYAQSCVSATSFAYIDLQGVCYASPDGLILVGPSGGSRISKDVWRRKQWRALGPENIHGVYHDGSYVMFLIGSGAGRAIAYDNTNGGIIEFNDDVLAVWHDRENDAVYVVDRSDRRLKEWRTDADEANPGLRTMLWRSRLETGHARTYSAVQVVAEAHPVTLRIFADGVMVLSVQTTSDEAFRPPPMGKHRDWYFEVEGTNHVQEVWVGSMHEMR